MIVVISGIAHVFACAPLELEIDLLSFGPGIEIPGYMPSPLRGYQEIPLRLCAFAALR